MKFMYLLDNCRSGLEKPGLLTIILNMKNIVLIFCILVGGLACAFAPLPASTPTAAAAAQPVQPVQPSAEPIHPAQRAPTSPPQPSPAGPAAPNPNPPPSPVKLIFIHHSTGQAWLDDGHGGLGLALRDNNYFVSDTNYGWGPDSIGDQTDIGHWWTWFRGPGSASYTAALYSEYEQHSGYTRMDVDPGGENEIIMFKSCFPNSSLGGSPSDPVPAIDQNPLRGEGVGDNHTVANAKGIYIDLLNYFSTRQDKLFVVIAAPPLIDGSWADNARAFNNWLVDEWLVDYPYKNVVVFDFYTVLTSNGGDIDTNDLGALTGNHHRYRNGLIEHLTTGGANTLAYPSGGDDHPNPAGDLKATAEFLPLLNIAYNEWKANPVAYTYVYLPLAIK